MPFTINLEYTPFCPQEGLPFTEDSFARRPTPFTFEVGKIGVALIDLWNFGWDDGPISESLGPDLSFERGIRVLFYMGFETDCCLTHGPRYGIAKMTGLDCLCTVVRDGTATYEAAETLEG